MVCPFIDEQQTKIERVAMTGQREGKKIQLLILEEGKCSLPPELTPL